VWGSPWSSAKAPLAACWREDELGSGLRMLCILSFFGADGTYELVGLYATGASGLILLELLPLGP